jgi:hypothetical protein
MKLADFEGKRVTFVRNLEAKNESGHGAEELDGVIQKVSPTGNGFILKPRGSSTTVLVETSTVEDGTMRIVVEQPKKLKPRVQSSNVSDVRAHLLQAHGWNLSKVNLTDDQAAKAAHDEINHFDLGHVHKDASDNAEEN